MTDHQLDEILRRHQAGEKNGSDTTVTTADGVWEVRKDRDVWRQKPDGGWDPVPPLRGNLKT